MTFYRKAFSIRKQIKTNRSIQLSPVDLTEISTNKIVLDSHADVTILKCTMCDASFYSLNSVVYHTKTVQHRCEISKRNDEEAPGFQNEHMNQEEPFLFVGQLMRRWAQAGPTDLIKCEICRIECCTESDFRTHIQSPKHCTTLQEYSKEYFQCFFDPLDKSLYVISHTDMSLFRNVHKFVARVGRNKLHGYSTVHSVSILSQQFFIQLGFYPGIACGLL